MGFCVWFSSPFPWACQLGLTRQYDVTPSEHKFRVASDTDLIKILFTGPEKIPVQSHGRVR